MLHRATAWIDAMRPITMTVAIMLLMIGAFGLVGILL
jgi:hypothetical protein